MTVLAYALLLSGAAITFIMPLWALLTWSSSRERKRVARLVVTRCADVTDSGKRLCAVEGRSVPGPAGMLTAPLSGEPCVWYFSEVVERVNADGESSRSVWEAGGTMAFALRDETGSVLVDGRLVHPDHESSRVNHSPPVRRVVREDVNSAERSTHLRGLIARGVLSEESFKRGWLDDSAGWSVREYVLPVDEPLHVQGRAALWNGHPVLGAARRKHLVAGGTHAQLTDRIEEDVRTGLGCLLIGVIGGPLLVFAGVLLFGWIHG